jgi:peptidyl-prolyl cis-trans isomerase D
MLLAIRERVMGVLGWFILGILFIAFAFFGLNSYLDSDKASYVASVNGVEISARQEDLAYRNLRSRMESLMGSSFGAS